MNVMQRYWVCFGRRADGRAQQRQPKFSMVVGCGLWERRSKQEKKMILLLGSYETEMCRRFDYF